MRAHYIALEGIEGAGKSSLAPMVVSLLEAAGRPALWVREPGGTEAGEAIRDILLVRQSSLEAWTEALLFAAQRAQLAAEVIGPALQAGTSVVGDRSVYSSLAYQGAGRGLGVDLVRTVNRAGLGYVWPDIVVLLHVDPGLGLERQAIPDRIGSEGLDFQSRVASAYGRLAAEEPDRFIVVQATGALDRVAATVVEEVLARW
ncbi:MAG TPA: dTMP kinase [Acidimicrobiia bacterium]